MTEKRETGLSTDYKYPAKIRLSEKNYEMFQQFSKNREGSKWINEALDMYRAGGNGRPQESVKEELAQIVQALDELLLTMSASYRVSDFAAHALTRLIDKTDLAIARDAVKEDVAELISKTQIEESFMREDDDEDESEEITMPKSVALANIRRQQERPRPEPKAESILDFEENIPERPEPRRQPEIRNTPRVAQASLDIDEPEMKDDEPVINSDYEDYERNISAQMEMIEPKTEAPEPTKEEVIEEKPIEEPRIERTKRPSLFDAMLGTKK